MQNQDDEVIRLLGKLNDAAPAYPSSMFNKRRAALMAAFAALNLGAATAGLSLLANLVKIVKGMGVVEKIVLGVEVAAVTGMTAYGAATAYVYRHEIRQVIEANLGLVTNTPFPSLTVPSGGGVAVQETLSAETGTPTVTPSTTPTGTLSLTPPAETNIAGETVGPPNATSTRPPPGATSTPPPVVQVTPTNCGKSGLCLGKSTRTPKVPGGGGGNP